MKLWHIKDRVWVSFGHSIDFFDALKSMEYSREEKKEVEHSPELISKKKRAKK